MVVYGLYGPDDTPFWTAWLDGPLLGWLGGPTVLYMVLVRFSILRNEKGPDTGWLEGGEEYAYSTRLF